MGWGYPLDVADLVARAQKRGDAYVKAWGSTSSSATTRS